MKADMLTREERQEISWRLAIDLGGAGLLAVGLGIAWLDSDQAQTGALFQAAAALLVAGGSLGRGLQGLFRREPVHVVDQVVSIAVIAAACAGDFLTATLVPLILDVGRLFEERSALGAHAAIDQIRGLQARVAVRLVETDEEEVPTSSLEPGDVVVVRPGEVVPADGVVLLGRSVIDQAPITGESANVEVGPASSVFEGARNISGLLQIEVESTGHETALGKVVELLRRAEAASMPGIPALERGLATYLPVALSLAAAVLFVTEDVSRSIAVLIVSAPSALVLAGPAAMVAAMSRAAGENAIVKSGLFFDRLSRVDTLALDKTGTLTQGQQLVSELHPADGTMEEFLLYAAALCGQGSLHPVSKAIVAEARARQLGIPSVTEAQELPGQGVFAEYEGVVYRIGRRDWLVEHGVDFSTESLRGEMGVWVSRGQTLLGFIRLHDPLREQASAILGELRELGIERMILLSGDRESEVARVAGELGIESFHAELLPERKAELISAEQDAGHVVLMVGDGINDALALQRADVGIAIGARLSEAALGGADAALMGPELERVPMLVELADQTRSTVVQNALLGICFSLAMFGLAALGVVSPLEGAVLHNFGALLVVANSARLARSGKVDPSQPEEEHGEQPA
jgi:Zn2+/Cd2+-exporting ATPase